MAGTTETAVDRKTFALKDCALIAIATGRKALTLGEFLDALRDITPDSIYYHFWGGLLQPRFEQREYNNDFAAWVRHSLHDAVLAERLAVLDPTEFPDMEVLRQEALELVEQRLDEDEGLHWTRASSQFEFIRSQIVVFDTDTRVEHAKELAGLVPHLSLGSIFYHFVDARRRLEGGYDDFRAWLAGIDSQYEALCADLAALDPYFGSLAELRQQLTTLFEPHLPTEEAAL
jgi:hypothetical protein